jgi:P4 family phage/plasmid primase-like protien
MNAPDWLLEIVRGGVSHGWTGVDGGDWSDQDGTEEGNRVWLESEMYRLRQVPPGNQHTDFIKFIFQMRVRGMRMVDALEWASRICAGFQYLEERGPWTDKDALDEVKRTWERVGPGSVDAHLKNWADQQQQAIPPKTEPSESPPALPPPTGTPKVIGEPPRAIGPDDENAQDLRIFAEQNLLWVSGGDWMYWNGQRWERDDSLQRHEIVRELGRKLVARAGSGECGEDERQWLVKRYQRLGTVGGRDTCLNYGRDLFAVAANALDADPWALNTPGGLVDLRSGTVRPTTPEDLVTQITKYPVREGATDEVWDRVHRERVPDPDDQAWLQRWMGYCLTGLTTEKAILAMHGPANTGKSTVTEPFGRALGTYAVSWDADTIVANSNVNRQEALYRARGARLVTVNEMKAGTRLDEGVIKGATGGDTIVGRALYQGSIEYRPQFKLWVHTNHVPNARDDALLARMLFFGMHQQLDRDLRDPGIKTWLEEAEEAGSAVLWWAVRGLHQLQVRGLGRPARSDIEVEEHALRSDPIRRFISDCMVQCSDDHATPWDIIISAYHAWCSAEQLKPMGTTTFTHALEERGVSRAQTRFEDGRRLRAARGWALASEDQGVMV